MKVEIDVCLGNDGVLVGDLVYSKDGSRESCQFKYTDEWLSSPNFFALSPQLKKSVRLSIKKQERWWTATSFMASPERHCRFIFPFVCQSVCD